MDVFESRYYKTNKFLMEILGLWPYFSPTRRLIGILSYFFLMSTLTVPMFLYLLLKEFDVYIFLQNMILILMLLVSQMKYTITFASASQFKLLFAQIKKDWKQITDHREIRILKKFAEESRLVTIFYIFYVYGTCVTYMTPPFTSMFLEFFFPLDNGSYPQLPPIWCEFLIYDQFDHYFLFNVHALLIFIWLDSLFIATDTILFCTAQHTAALFSIVCFRLKNMFNSDDYDVSLDKLKKGVEMFNNSIKCCDLLEDSFSICIFIILMLSTLGVATSSILILKIDDVFMKVKVTTVMGGIIIQVLFLNWVGQKIIDTSEKVFDSVYLSDWYLMPPKLQKLVIIIMCRTLNPHEFRAGKMVTLSIYMFGKLMRTCLSVFAAVSYMYTGLNQSSN